MKRFFSMLFLTMLLSSFNVNACFTSWFLASYIVEKKNVVCCSKDTTPEIYCNGRSKGPYWPSCKKNPTQPLKPVSNEKDSMESELSSKK